MFVLMRALTYAAIFIGLVLIFVPARLLSWIGISRPEVIGVYQVGGMAIAAAGAMIVIWCLLVFAFVGRGTPAPFDPPRRLVIRGPYKHVRNPMYIGAGLALGGAALFHQSFELLGYTAVFMIITHLFVVYYEEPKLRRSFGAEYTAYCRQVDRWRPRT